jgi:putative transcriptional regulator
MSEQKGPETRLRAARRAKGLRQEDLAEAAEVSQSTIVRLELGENEPTFKTAHRLARALGTTAEELFGGADTTGEAVR